MSRKSRSRRERTRADLESWFQEEPPCEDFVGVIVFQRRKLAKRDNRIGVAADSYMREKYLREGSDMTMPFTAQPDAQWSRAPAIGFATTVEEALDLICNGKNEDEPTPV